MAAAVRPDRRTQPQIPPEQSSEPQHPVLIVQAPPAFRQQYVGPPDVNEAHARPDAQQFGALAPDVHDAPSPIEHTAGARHVPL